MHITYIKLLMHIVALFNNAHLCSPLKRFKMEEVALHCSRYDCWTVYNKKVYNITQYLGNFKSITIISISLSHSRFVIKHYVAGICGFFNRVPSWRSSEANGRCRKRLYRSIQQVSSLGEYGLDFRQMSGWHIGGRRVYHSRGAGINTYQIYRHDHIIIIFYF